MKEKRIPFVTINAKDNYEFGFKLGKALRKNIQFRLEKNKEIYKKKCCREADFSVLIEKSKKFIPVVKRNFPNLLEEAKAIAEGAQVSFEELFVLMCDEEIVNFETLRCTSIAVRTEDNSILLGHNEDWIPEYRKDGLFLVKGKIKNNKFLALSYMGSLAGSACGINSFRVAYSDNSLDTDKFTYGVPRSFHLRALLESKNPKQAIKILNKGGSIISNTTMVFSNISILGIEEHWNSQETFRNKDVFIHTNHTISKKLQTKAQKADTSSIKRYNRAVELVSKQKSLNIEILKKILRDHKGNICDHFDRKDKLKSAPTIASIIMNPKDKWIMLAEGNPCKSKYRKYNL